MSFLLVIRNHLQAAGDDFGAADVRRFDRSPVWVGRGDTCHCQLDDPDLGPVHFAITQAGEAWRIELAPEATGATVFVNQTAVSGGGGLHSGDEIRVGHWTLRFQQAREVAARSRWSSLLACTAKAMLGTILVAEILVAAWLPAQVRAAARIEFQVAKRRTILLLDQLRGQVRRLSLSNDLEQAARQTIAVELDSVARFVRLHEDALGRDQWRQVYRDLLEYQHILDRLQAGNAFPPLPAVDLDASVRAVLTQPQPGKEKPPAR